jgi:hypothetical protein
MEKHADYIKKDPFRRGLHYPAVEGVLGDFNEKHILDVGCVTVIFRNCWPNGEHLSAVMTSASKKLLRQGTTRTRNGLHARSRIRRGDVSHGVAICYVS